MTFAELLIECYDECNYKSVPAPDIETRFKRWVNRGLALILSDPGRTKLRDVKGLPFLTAAQVPDYGLPLAMERIDRMYTLDNPRNLVLRDDSWLRNTDPSETSEGTPHVHVDHGIKAVFRRPRNTGLWAVSSNVVDLQPFTIVGVLTVGDKTPPILTTLNGTTPVSIANGDLFADVLSFTLQTQCAGTVSLFDAATAGHLLSRIQIGDVTARWQRHRLWPTPSAVETVFIDGQSAIVPLVNETDTPTLPGSFQDLPALYAQLRHWKKQGDTKRVGLCLDEWNVRIGKLNAYLDYPADWRGMSGRTLEDDARWNNLGGDYPADGYGE